MQNDLDEPPLRSEEQFVESPPKLAVALRFYESASFQLNVGDMDGVSQATCCKVVHRIIAAIWAKKMHLVHFSDTPEERKA